MLDHKFRAGFVSIVGKPNVGKSTLMNKLLGEKLSIISPKPQTTRQQVKGIFTDETRQIVFLDTPGFLKARYELHRKMQEYLKNSLKDSDVELAFGSVQYQIGVQGDVSKYVEYLSEAEAGNIICGHDSRNCELDSGMPENITDIIPEIKQVIREREISIVTISEMFETQ